MNLIELHILQSFPVTCLNRDDVGAPKTAYFGGCQRARVSSQSWKRAIREETKKKMPSFYAGERGHFQSNRLAQELEKRNVSEAKEKADKLIACLANNRKKYKSGEKSNAATFFSSLQLSQIAQSIAEEKIRISTNTEGEVSLSGKKINEIINGACDSADIAIFGRMVANDHTLMVEGAGLFSHALSTHKASNEIDFFSAVDETKSDEEDVGAAGHIGTLEFNSACYYRYVGLNTDMLKDENHLAHLSHEEQEKVIHTFLQAAIMAVPGARKNSMFGCNPPSYILALKREGQPLSMVNAFEEPVRSAKGYIKESKDRLKAQWEKLRKTYNLDGAACELPENDLETLIGKML